MEPVQRGGAGVVRRHTSGTNAGPASAHRVRAITWAVRRRKTAEANAKVAAAVAQYLDDVPGVVVVDELPVAERLRLVVALDPPRRPAEAAALAAECPHYIDGTFKAFTDAGRPRTVGRIAAAVAPAPGIAIRGRG